MENSGSLNVLRNLSFCYLEGKLAKALYFLENSFAQAPVLSETSTHSNLAINWLSYSFFVSVEAKSIVPRNVFLSYFVETVQVNTYTSTKTTVVFIR